MLMRSEARKIAMTCLYQIDILKQNNLEYDIKDIIKQNLEVEDDFVNVLVNGTINNLTILDELANKYLNDWSIKRLDKAGANILRMALYELTNLDTPPVVVINEAVELAKTYSTLELAHMINGALDKYVKETK